MGEALGLRLISEGKNYPLKTSQAASRPIMAPTMLRLRTNFIGGTLTAWRASTGESLFFMI
jgi:hypothetical protein